ncbi:LacI family DNA-binding transcriptional regulator [Shewanella nanhaiensis]|uniref:LacI family DNA-binding transcriptional regulator n=1 Tax=Shewanella nanhaiensis TaxID=2864872 RepID=A0ABS7E3N8_9GAMM|nr:LacI family DNA-binding transcriptional regulator [Shewanella nanhaiensis]MBW8184316.1 LacI family DNA-binding transcriptional regulator [Shewanella nanhaiensis]
MNKKRVMTLADIALLANVSKSTASRALRNNPLINKNTRELVQEIALKHNFKVNATASNLRTQKTNTIAVVVMFDQKSGQAISDPFLMEILGTIADELTHFGYDMLLTTTKTATHDWYSYYYESKRADGLIIIGQGEHDQRIEALISTDLPFIVWGTEIHEKNYTTVGSDNRKGGYLAVSHLIEQGCRRIAFLGDINHTEVEQRWLGYQDAVAEAGLVVEDKLQIKTDFTSVDGYQSLRDHCLSDDVPIDGVFAVSDAIALGATKYLFEQNITIPKQVAVIGFDDISMSEYCSPSLSTIRQNTAAGGRLLVKLMLDKLNHLPVDSQLLNVEMIQRQSSSR